jgi:hypothetical protein
MVSMKPIFRETAGTFFGSVFVPAERTKRKVADATSGHFADPRPSLRSAAPGRPFG